MESILNGRFFILFVLRLERNFVSSKYEAACKRQLKNHLPKRRKTKNLLLFLFYCKF